MRPVHLLVCGFALLCACGDRPAPPPPERDAGFEVDASQPPTEPDGDDAGVEAELVIGPIDNACTVTLCPRGTRCQVVEGQAACVRAPIVLVEP